MLGHFFGLLGAGAMLHLVAVMLDTEEFWRVSRLSFEKWR